MSAVSFQAYTERIFLLIAMRENVGELQEIVNAAVAEVLAQCREDADRSDRRLCWLAAALANLRWRQMIAAQGAVSPTAAGCVPRDRDDSAPCSFAERLYHDYRDAAASLLRDDSFLFERV